MTVNYDDLTRAPLVHLLQVEGDGTQAPQDRLTARKALYARVGELNGAGWVCLGEAARHAMARLFDGEKDNEERADAAAKKVHRRAA